MRSKHIQREAFFERWPVLCLSQSDNLPDRVKAIAATQALTEGRMPHRTRGDLVRLASKVPGVPL